MGRLAGRSERKMEFFSSLPVELRDYAEAPAA